MANACLAFENKFALIVVDIEFNEINIMLDLHILREQIVETVHPRPHRFR